MADENDVRVYGMADQANRDPAPAEGMRGARSSTQPRRVDPDLSHQVRLDTGSTVTVSEGSGVAFAESTGRAGLAEPKPWLEPVAHEEPMSRSFDPVPLIAGLSVAIGIIAFTAWRMRRDRGAEIAFAPDPDLAR